MYGHNMKYNMACTGNPLTLADVEPKATKEFSVVTNESSTLSCK